MNKTRTKIMKFAQNRKVELDNWGETGFMVREGSTFVHIDFSIVNDETKDVMVSFYSPVVRGVRVDNILMSKLLKLNSELNFGAFALIDDLVLLKYNILGGDHMNEEEFYNALAMVAIVSDEYDNKIIATHGGVTAVDFIMDIIREKEGRSIDW